ncbi:immunoglobulin superfamily member 1-like [Acipenser oxyrinchus oxyrinchus]|nr:immunoglobulin superfamily member 1-like [Acipenser oxyrinchus oxyrinchus]
MAMLTVVSCSGQYEELFTTPTLTFTPVSPVWEGEAVTLQCGAQVNKQGTRLLYRYSKDRSYLGGAGSQDQHSVPAAGLRDRGSYQCEVEAAGTGLKKRSDSVRLSVKEGRPKPALSREGRGGEIFEGDAVTLRCVVQGVSGGWSYLWYKDRQGAPVHQTDSSSGTGAGYTISAAALSHSGEYWCRAGRGRNTFYSQYSDPIWVNVTALFSRVTLTASPGATVKEGEALNLTCEAAVNKTPRPQLHYTIVRDGEPVTSSIDSALYSIASTEKSHTGSYTCAVESQGVKKSSQELHIELETSWQSAAAAGFSVGFFVILLLIVFTLLLLYHKIRGFPCITDGKRRLVSTSMCTDRVLVHYSTDKHFS